MPEAALIACGTSIFIEGLVGPPWLVRRGVSPSDDPITSRSRPTTPVYPRHLDFLRQGNPGSRGNVLGLIRRLQVLGVPLLSAARGLTHNIAASQNERRPVGWHSEPMAMRCLIVDDSGPFLKAARALLESEGVAVVGVASTSAEALRQSAELRPDVTLVDIDLGGESGFDLARRLVEDGGRASSPVILISTHAEEDLADLIAESPALGFLSKSELSTAAIHDLLASKGDGE
jgi:CheY-like chemotaxis protein